MLDTRLTFYFPICQRARHDVRSTKYVADVQVMNLQAFRQHLILKNSFKLRVIRTSYFLLRSYSVEDIGVEPMTLSLQS